MMMKMISPYISNGAQKPEVHKTLYILSDPGGGSSPGAPAYFTPMGDPHNMLILW